MKIHSEVIVRSAATAFFLFSCTLVAGCNPALDPKKYGEVVTELPQVEGAEKPFPLPKLEDPQAAEEQDQK